MSRYICIYVCVQYIYIYIYDCYQLEAVSEQPQAGGSKIISRHP